MTCIFLRDKYFKGIIEPSLEKKLFFEHPLKQSSLQAI
jgi:hypothetical protein